MAHDIYQDDLAQIHIEGYGFHWERAAPALLGFLERYGIARGTVVDLGCGGGQWLARLAEEGYAVCGVDLSASMIEAARRLVPAGTFIHGSIDEVELPPCDAVTSLGEPINYLASGDAIRRVFRNVHAALRPGGVFIFDAREPAAGPVEPRVVTRVGDTWACIAHIEEDHEAGTIVRDITTFRQIGEDYRRGHEIHRLKVFPKNETVGWLRELGFPVRTFRGYGEYRFGPRQSAYVARKT